MEHYRSAFACADADALVEGFDYPVQVVSVAGTGRLSPWQDGMIGRRSLRVCSAPTNDWAWCEVVPQALEVDEPMVAVAVVRVHWALHREDGNAVYDFTAVYTLVRLDNGLRIVAIAHDELPKLQAALHAL